MQNNHPYCLSGFLIVAILISCGHIAFESPTYQPPFMKVETEWVDTTISQLSLDEKIGQLFILKSTLAYSPRKTEQLVMQYQPAGVLIQDVSKQTYQEKIHQLRSISKIPLLELSGEMIALNNQFSDLPAYPNNASISVLNRDFLERSLHRKLVSDYQQMGINCSLSPNIQSIEANPTAFHQQQQPENGLALISQAADKIEALQDRKILAIANAFDFYIDSIPDVAITNNGFLNKYKPLVISGLSGILMDEQIFEGDSITHRLPEFYKSFLQTHLQFDGLIFGEVTDNISLEELIYAGATTFLVEEADFEKNVNHLKELVNTGIISESVISEKVHKILMAKKWMDLDKKRYGQVVKYSPKKVSNKEVLFTRELFEHSIILANNPDSILPFSNTYTKQFKVVNVGQKSLRTFQNNFFNYANFSNHLYRPKKNGKINGLAFNPIRNGAFVITLDELNLSATEHEVFIASINTINESSKVVVVNYGNPMNLGLLDSTITAIQVFERNKITEALVPQLLFGAIEARGTLPIEIASWLPKGKRITTPIVRLKHTLPEEVGISSKSLEKIDDIFASAIHRKATPGGQVLIAKGGKVIYSKTFGHHTYDQVQKVEKTDLYDVASITKTAATTLAAMRLYEEEQIFMNAIIKDQMPLSKESTIKNILLKDLFIHKSGLQRNMPIAPYLNNRGFPENCTPYFCQYPSDKYALEVARSFYFDPTYLDSIYLSVSKLPRNYRHRRYLYSDVNFYLIHQLLEGKIKMDLDVYLKANFYQQLGLRFLTYKPLDRFPADVIAPTQDDRFWRKDQVRGYVHDEAAAILGGVGGNAGLFANAEDLAVLFQMLLNGGRYGGQQFLEKETIDYFTSAKHGNHRGLGFDKARYNYTASKSASLKTYGHSGFSGTCVWVDPDEELIYIFLSNRIHPDARNDQLKKMRVRQRVHQVVYDALKETRTKALNVNMAGE